jgi:uncharacterized protein
LKRTGEVVLPLHWGHAPPWLVTRMKSLADEMVRVMVQDRGTGNFLEHISDPYWFQAFGCVLGFDWHSSGLTTVVTGVLKNVLTLERHGVVLAGGKGSASRKSPAEIEQRALKAGLSGSKIEELKHASRMCAKVDTAAIQAGYPIYHHAFFLNESGKWAVVQQGICTNDRTARRYHWLSGSFKSFVEEPHEAIVGEIAKPSVLNVTANESAENRKTCVDLVRDRPQNLVSSVKALYDSEHTLDQWTTDNATSSLKSELGHLRDFQAFSMPSRINWQIFFDMYNVQPKNYEELLAFDGVGPATIRALALVSQLIYGTPASWKDPVKYSFAHGGKDGVPFPVDRGGMDGTIRYLKEMLGATEIERKLREDALRSIEKISVEWGL